MYIVLCCWWQVIECLIHFTTDEILRSCPADVDYIQKRVTSETGQNVWVISVSYPQSVFTARCYASAVLAMGLCLSVRVRLSVTSRSSTKTAKRRITQTTPHDTPGSLVFWCQRSPRNSTGVTPYEGAECRWGGQNRRLSTNSRLYLENSKR